MLTLIFVNLLALAMESPAVHIDVSATLATPRLVATPQPEHDNATQLASCRRPQPQNSHGSETAAFRGPMPLPPCRIGGRAQMSAMINGSSAAEDMYGAAAAGQRVSSAFNLASPRPPAAGTWRAVDSAPRPSALPALLAVLPPPPCAPRGKAVYCKLCWFFSSLPRSLTHPSRYGAMTTSRRRVAIYNRSCSTS